MAVGSTSVVFPPGSFALLVNDERCVQISLLEDDVIEGDEQLTLHLEATPSIIFNPIYSTVTIQDTNSKFCLFLKKDAVITDSVMLRYVGGLTCKHYCFCSCSCGFYVINIQC